ncbi:LysE family transporter [bacterium]|nr:LysE family transporter [bacterium]
MFNYLAMGLVLGLSAGFTPGPLSTLIITETLQYNAKSGMKVALAPIIVDFPIIILSVLILQNLSNFDIIMGVISMVGGSVVLGMGYKSFLAKEIAVNLEKSNPKSLSKGVLVNALSPHPYIFWFSVGAPMLTKAMDVNNVAPALFVGSFYLMLVGVKMMLALLTGKSKGYLTGKRYRVIMRVLGLVLVLFAIMLFKEGLELLGVV